MKPILILLPSEGFDPSEASVPWQLLHEAGQRVRFATPDGRPAQADPLMVTGEGLDLWGWVPLVKRIKLIGLTLRANRRAREAYAAMLRDPEFLAPLKYQEVDPRDFDGILLPGGHAKTMRPYLESPELRDIVVQALAAGDGVSGHIPIAAVCHGVLLLARASGADGVSVIADRKVTALPWAFEHKAWMLNRVFRFWDPNYYRTYLESKGEPTGYWGVEQEIKRCLRHPEQFINVPRCDPDFRRKTDGLHRDTPEDTRAAWVVRDGNLITARWPGDVHLFGKTMLAVVKEYRQVKEADLLTKRTDSSHRAQGSPSMELLHR